MQGWLEQPLQPQATETHTWSWATSGIVRGWHWNVSCVRWKLYYFGKMQAKWLFSFFHIKISDPFSDFSNYFCCLLQYYKETYTCQNSHHLIRSLVAHNHIAGNSFYTMGNSNREIPLFKYPVPRSMIDVVQDRDGTDIQICWTKARQLRSQKQDKIKTNKTKQSKSKNWPKDSQFLSLIKKSWLKTPWQATWFIFLFALQLQDKRDTS